MTPFHKGFAASILSEGFHHNKEGKNIMSRKLTTLATLITLSLAGVLAVPAQAKDFPALTIVQMYDDASVMCNEDATSHYPKYFSPQLACDAVKWFTLDLANHGYCNPAGSADHFWRKGKANVYGNCLD